MNIYNLSLSGKLYDNFDFFHIRIGGWDKKGPCGTPRCFQKFTKKNHKHFGPKRNPNKLGEQRFSKKLNFWATLGRCAISKHSFSLGPIFCAILKKYIRCRVRSTLPKTCMYKQDSRPCLFWGVRRKQLIPQQQKFRYLCSLMNVNTLVFATQIFILKISMHKTE